MLNYPAKRPAEPSKAYQVEYLRQNPRSAPIETNQLFNSPLTIRLFIWETRLGKDRILDRSTEPYPTLNGEQT